MHDEINAEQIEHHRKTNRSISRIVLGLLNIGQNHQAFFRQAIALQQSSVNALACTVKNTQDATSQIQLAAQSFQQTSLHVEDRLQLSANELSEVIAQLSEQLKQAKAALSDASTRSSEIKTKQLETENRALKRALRQTMDDFESLLQKNIALQKKLEASSQLTPSTQQNTSPSLTLFSNAYR